MNPSTISAAGAIGTFAALSFVGAKNLPRKLGHSLASTIEMISGDEPLYFSGRFIGWNTDKYNWQTVGQFSALVAAGVLLGGAAQSGMQIRT